MCLGCQALVRFILTFDAFIVRAFIGTMAERVVGGTMRPDGTLRKERKIRPGYVPQDEQPVYQSAGRQVPREAAARIAHIPDRTACNVLPRPSGQTDRAPHALTTPAPTPPPAARSM